MKVAAPNKFKVNDVWFRLFPPFGYEDRQAFVESIKQKGILKPIEVLEDMTILDGHQRHSVATEFGIEIPYVVKKISVEEAPQYIVETNLHRRHLTKFQKIMIAHRTATEWGWFEEAEEAQTSGLKEGPVSTESVRTGRTTERIAKAFKVPREGLELYQRLQKKENFSTIAALSRDDVTMEEAKRKLDAESDRPKSTIPSEKYVVGMTNGVELYRVAWARLGDRLFSPTRGDTITLTIKYNKSRPTKEKQEDKAWKPTPFRGLACNHGIVGGCWRCYPELNGDDHRKKGSVHKQDTIRLPTDSKEVSGFTIRPDASTKPCPRCDLYVDGKCTWDSSLEVPKDCRFWKHKKEKSK